MRKKIRFAMTAFCVGLLGPAQWAAFSAHAQEGMDTSGTTAATSEEVTGGYMKDETIGIKPQLGVLAFKDALGDNTARAAGGIEFEWNATKALGIDPSWYVGPTTGFIYSHLGAPTSNFVGTSPDVPGNEGSNLLLIPADLKVGYNFTDMYRLSVHGGGNVIYRSVASALNLSSDNSDVGNNDSLWRIYPNVGADVEFAFSRNVSMLIRPDVTITPGDDFFTGTVALGIALS